MKKQRLTTITVLLLSLLFALPSCTDEFKEVSKNPNTSSEALPQALLAPALTEVVSANMSRARRINNELMQVAVMVGDTEGRIFRYDIRRSEADYLWNNWFVQLINFKDMYTTAERLYSIEQDKIYNTYRGISLICQSWLCSMLTDTYGDMPYFEASKGKEGVLMPAFDTQEDIYYDMMERLEEANNLLANGINLTEDQMVADPVYAGNAAKWRKFGNSLYLRILLRIAAKDELFVADKIKEMVETKSSTYPVMGSNDDTAALYWTGATPYISPFQNMRDADWRLSKLATFFIDNLNNWNDPRRNIWARRVDGVWAGVPSGYPVGQPVVAKSVFLVELQSDPRLGNIMNYAELEFILAEAATKGYISTNAKTHYEAGITAALGFWGLPLPSDYLAHPDLQWDDKASVGTKMSKIHLQKYYALFFTDLQQWFEYRRTGLPLLPKGAGLLNNGIMPARLNYPVYLQSTNRDHYHEAVARQGADEISTEVWWQRTN